MLVVHRASRKAVDDKVMLNEMHWSITQHTAHSTTNLSSLCNAMALAVRHSYVSESIIAAINLFQCFAIWLIYSVSGADVCARARECVTSVHSFAILATSPCHQIDLCAYNFICCLFATISSAYQCVRQRSNRSITIRHNSVVSINCLRSPCAHRIWSACGT